MDKSAKDELLRCTSSSARATSPLTATVTFESLAFARLGSFFYNRKPCARTYAYTLMLASQLCAVTSEVNLNILI